MNEGRRATVPPSFLQHQGVTHLIRLNILLTEWKPDPALVGVQFGLVSKIGGVRVRGL